MGLDNLQNVVLMYNFLQGPFLVFHNGVVADAFFGNRFHQQEPGPCDQRVSILLEVASGFGFPVQLAQNWSGNDPCNGSWIGTVCKQGRGGIGWLEGLISLLLPSTPFFFIFFFSYSSSFFSPLISIEHLPSFFSSSSLFSSLISIEFLTVGVGGGA
jgi:hypothetical protein